MGLLSVSVSLTFVSVFIGLCFPVYLCMGNFACKRNNSCVSVVREIPRRKVFNFRLHGFCKKYVNVGLPVRVCFCVKLGLLKEIMVH